LVVWQKSFDLTKQIYLVTEKLPRNEQFCLSSQMRRSVVSIPSNIAEGYARKHRQEYSQFIKIAFGSGAELETQIIITKRLELAQEKDYQKVDGLLVEVMKMLNAFNSSLVAKL